MRTVTIVECPEISLEDVDFSGISLETNTTWNEFKKFVGLDDESKAKKRLDDLKFLVKDLHLVKSRISSAHKNQTMGLNLAHVVKNLPLKGDTGAEIAKSMSAYRHKLQKCVAKAENIKTKQELEHIKEEIKNLSNEKHELPSPIVIQRADILHMCDELILISELEMEIIKKGLSLKKDQISTESYMDCIEVVALEGFFSKLGATLLGILSVLVALEGFRSILLSFFMAAVGAWGFGVGLALYGILMAFGSKFLFEKAAQFWKEERGEE